MIQLIKEEITNILQSPLEDIDETINFLRLGISSINTLKIINRLRKKLDVDINPIAMFEYKTIADFADYLCELKNEEM